MTALVTVSFGSLQWYDGAQQSVVSSPGPLVFQSLGSMILQTQCPAV